jgi:signal transduction histidine kinase
MISVIYRHLRAASHRIFGPPDLAPDKAAALARLTEDLTARTADLEDAARLARIGTWSLRLEPYRVTWSQEVYAIFARDPALFPLEVAEIIACVHPDDRERFSTTYAAMIREGHDDAMEFRIVRPSGEIRHIRELARARRDVEGNIVGIAGVIQDVTEQKVAAEALLRSEKLKTIGQITGGIAHDFNNLLTVVSLNLELALDDPDLPPSLRPLLDQAQHGTTRSAELTAQLLAYARRQSLRPLVVDLRAQVETVLPLLQRAVGDRHVLQFAPAEAELLIEIDPGQFENALMNLVINARDALQEHGHIGISLAAATLSAKLAGQPDTVPEGRYVRVRVADDGSGIPAEILHQIFEPFFTTKPMGSGSGLGLSMVYGFVQQSRGCLQVCSTPGQGTSIDLYFPLAVLPQDIPAAPVAVPDFRALGLSVLVVEDRAELRATLVGLFAHLGFRTTDVASAEAALEVLAGEQRFDLLFSDIILTGAMNGAILARKAERLCPGIAIVLASGESQEVNVGELNWPVLQKPFRQADLVDVLARIPNLKKKEVLF